MCAFDYRKLQLIGVIFYEDNRFTLNSNILSLHPKWDFVFNNEVLTINYKAKYKDVMTDEHVYLNSFVGSNSSGKTAIIERFSNYQYIILEYRSKIYLLSGKVGYSVHKNLDLYKHICEIKDENSNFKFTLDFSKGIDTEILGNNYINEGVSFCAVKLNDDLENNQFSVEYFKEKCSNVIKEYEEYISNCESYFYNKNVKIKLDECVRDVVNHKYTNLSKLQFDVIYILSEFLELDDENPELNNKDSINSYIDECLKRVNNKHLTKLINEYLNLEPSDTYDVNNLENLKNRVEVLNEIFKELKLTEPSSNNYGTIKSPVLLQLINTSEGTSFFLELMNKIDFLLKENKNYLVLLIDELDRSFHPILQMVLQKEIAKFINANYVNDNLKIHIIFTTHSPFLTLDLFENQLYRLQCNEDTNFKIKINKSNSTFGSNIIDIIRDDFYLDSIYGTKTLDVIKNKKTVYYDFIEDSFVKRLIKRSALDD